MTLNPRKLPPGTQLRRFVVRELLGRGATATVYAAEDVADGAELALKVLHRDPRAEEERAADRMKREVELVQRIRHPAICGVYGLHFHEDLMFLAMEYIRGRTLEQLIRDEERLELERTLRIMSVVSRALAAAHAQGVLHRDLKPGNVMLREDGAPVLLDFGYATAPDMKKVTITGAWVGTLHFAAPEMLEGERASSVSDVYALGVMLYQALTGKLPFDGFSYGEVASAKLYQQPDPPSTHAPGLPPSVDALVLEAMARSPSKRIPSAAKLEAALEALLRGADPLEDEEITEPDARGPPAASVELNRSPPLTRPNTPEPAVPPPEPPAPEPAAAERPSAAPVVDIDAELDELRATARERGLRIGDQMTVDSLDRAARLEAKMGKLADAHECVRLAFDELDRVVIDAEFVGRKRDRFEDAYRRTGGFKQLAKFRPVLMEILKAMKAEDYVAANEALNRGFDMLD